MNNLKFAHRGPFKIAHQDAISYYFRFPYYSVWRRCAYTVATGWNMHLLKWRMPPSISWYRKPSLQDRGPFKFDGFFQTAYDSVVNTWVITFPPAIFFHPEQFGLLALMGEIGRAPWIYYSRNISNGLTCR